MPTSSPTLADLREAAVINSREIVAAIDAYMRDPAAGAYRFLSGHSIDISSIVDATPALSGTELGPQEKTFRNAVAVAIMAAHPTEP